PRRTAAERVAQALATFITGMPVWPICCRIRCPTMALAWNRHPAAMNCTSWMSSPPSSSASSAASPPSSGTSFSGWRPNLSMPTPATNTSAAMGNPPSGRATRGAEVERDDVVALLVLLAHAGRHLHRHAEPDRLGLRLDVDDVAAHRHALRQVDHADDIPHWDAPKRPVQDGVHPQRARA